MPIALFCCGVLATIAAARAGSISQSQAFPVTNQAVTLTVSSDLLGTPITVSGPLGGSELTPDAQGQVIWTPARYGKYTLACGDATNAIWVTARPMKFHWWSCTTAQKNVTEVMQQDAAWAARGVTRVDWTGGDYLAQSPDKPDGYTTAQQWYDNWTYAYDKDGMALDEMWCDNVARTNAMLQAISMVRAARGSTYSINVWSAGIGTDFAAGAANFKANKVCFLIEDYDASWANHKGRWDKVRSYGLQNQAISGIWPGSTALRNEAQVRADIALVRLAEPNANGIAIFAPMTQNYTPADLPTVLNDCDQAIEDYYLKPLIHLTVTSNGQLVAWNLGNEDATGFSLQLLNSSSGVVQTIDLSGLVANGKQTLAIPAGAVNAKVINPAGTANLYTGNSQYSTGLYPLLVPGRYTWTNANGDNLWNTFSNWNPHGPPPGNIDSGNTAYFDGTTSTPGSVTAPTGEVSISGVQFTTAGWTIAGNATSQDFYTYGIQSSGAGTNTINTGISARDVVPASFNIGADNTLVMNGLIGAVRNNGGLVKNGAGTLTVTYANTFTGGTTINSGTLIAEPGSLPGNVNNKATLQIGRVTGAALASGLRITGAGLTIITNGNNGYTNLSAANQLSSSGDLNATQVRINQSGFNQTIGALNGNAFWYNNGVSCTLTMGNNNGSGSFSGSFANSDSSHALSLVKTGSGIQTLTGSSSHSGTTAINQGTLFVNNQLGNSAVTVASSGTLAGTGSAAGTVTASGTIAPGASGTSAGTLATGAAALTGIYVCQIDGATADRWNITGNLNVTGATLAVSEIRTATFTSAVIAKYSGTLTGTFTVSPALPFGIAVQYDATAKEIRLVSNFNSWTGSHTFAAGSDTSPSGDPDGDGMTNRREYAFGLDPTSGTSHNPIPVPLAKDNASFTYTRRKPSLTGLAYKIWTSPDLVEWTVDTGATQSPVDQGDNQTVHVLLGSPGPFANGNLFVRVSAD